MAAESSPLLSGADARRAPSAQRTRKILCMVLMASAVVVLLVASKAAKPTELVQWVVPKAAHGANIAMSKKMSYIYVQSAALQYDKAKHTEVFNSDGHHSSKLTPLQSRIRAQTLVELAPNQTVAPKGSVRSCAISSLVMQATLVLHGWGICGYMLHPVSETSKTPTMGFITNFTDGPDAVISGPPNNTFCTPERMNSPPCNTEWVRTLARNNPSSFKTCLGKIKGVSQTCATFDKCGPHRAVPSGDGMFSESGGSKGVCNTPDVSYFKEPEILAMCGICDMFRATMPAETVSPRAGFIPTKKAAAGSLRAAGLSGLLTLAVAAVAAARALA